MTWKFRWLSLVYIALETFAFDQPSGVIASCAAGLFYAGSAANVTCYFHTDLSLIAINIDVTFIPFNSTDDQAVSYCFVTKNKHQDCLLERDYIMNGNITDQLTLIIPNVTTKHAGHYICQAGNPHTSPRNCTLHVINAAPQQRTNYSSSNSSNICHQFTETSFQCKEMELKYIIFGISILLGICIILIFILFLHIRRWKKNSRIIITEIEPLTRNQLESDNCHQHSFPYSDQANVETRNISRSVQTDSDNNEANALSSTNLCPQTAVLLKQPCDSEDVFDEKKEQANVDTEEKPPSVLHGTDDVRQNTELNIILRVPPAAATNSSLCYNGKEKT